MVESAHHCQRISNRLLLACAMLALSFIGNVAAQTTAFSYQGKLTDTGAPANSQYDFQFKLFDTQTVGTGTQQGSPVTVANVTVTAGIFTAQLDFGACASCFNGSPRFLEIAVKPTSGSTFTTLSPRQPVGANPYAIRSLAATAADGLTVACVSCITSSQIQSVRGAQVTGNIAGSQINGAIPVASVPTGSASYVQNTTAPQAATNFNISGNGTAGGTISGNIINATSQYSLGGNTILSNPGTNNLFAGIGSGQANTNGSNNAFFGSHAGQANVFAHDNTFVGYNAGLNTVGGSIIGVGNSNSFFGSGAGQANTAGNNNSFFGEGAGQSTTASSNSFFGEGAGQSNTTGDNNTFIGRFAGNKSGLGRLNTFVGAVADFTSANAVGDKNTLVGASTQITSGLTNAAAIGAQAMVTQSNSLVLGQISGVNGAAADTNVGIGTTAPAARLHIKDGSANILLGAGSDCVNHGIDAAIFFDSSINSTCANYILASYSDGIIIKANTPAGFINFNFGNSQSAYLDSSFGLVVNNNMQALGKTVVNLFSPSGSTTQVCNDSHGTLTTCSSSLRYKTDLHPFVGGLSVINRLKPITFRWQGDGVRDVGFGAEDVAEVEPLLTFNNNKGQVEGVKYDRLSAVFVNAIKEQQAQIDQQQAQLKEQQQQNRNQRGEIKQLREQVEALKKMVCLDHPGAEICQL